MSNAGRQQELSRSASQLVVTSPLWGTLGNVWRHFWLSQLRKRGALLAWSRQWPWMLNTIKCKGEPTPTLRKKNYPAQSVNSAEVQKLFQEKAEEGGVQRGLYSHKHTIARMPAKKGNSLTCSTNCCSNSIIRGVKFLCLLRSLKLFFQTKGEKRTAQKKKTEFVGRRPALQEILKRALQA